MKIFDTATLEETTPLSPDWRSWIYNGLDCCVTAEIYNQLSQQADSTTRETYKFSLRLQGPVLEMTLRGLPVALFQRDKVLAEYRRLVILYETAFNKICSEGIGVPCNWRSPKQMANLLYGILGLPEQKKRSANGEFTSSTGRAALEKLNVLYDLAKPIVSLSLLLRDLGKKIGFLSTALDDDRRIRCNFNIAGTTTGRLSSSMSDFGTGTNLQNVDPKLRSIFFAPAGRKFCNLDLEQADARNVGAICWNLFHARMGPELAGAYLDMCESGDLHTRVAKMVWPELTWPEDPTKWRAVADSVFYRGLSYRDTAKRLGHGTNYLGQPRTMAMHTKIPEYLVTAFQSAYFSAFPCLKAWHETRARELRELGSITTLLDRRRYFFNRLDDASTLREAIAFEPQSLTGDEVNLGLLNLFKHPKIWLHVQVHDSVLFSYPEELEDEIVPWALKAMRVNIPLIGGRSFVVPTDAKIGWNWGDYESWTEEDFKKKRCAKEKIGTCRTNPEGLMKWKGHDPRKRLDRLARAV